ncbi:MAG: metallopeptidase family protein [Bifidobacteriaceae bacterium]|nr:metallopeptidase family protein [Bifidobacteriaceae bacterium]
MSQSAHTNPPSDSTPLSEMAPWNRHRYRNLHGRGQRQPMFGVHLPYYRTTDGFFDDCVKSVLIFLSARIPDHGDIEVAKEFVPPSDPFPWEDHMVPLSRSFPAKNGQKARIVLYQMPIMERVQDKHDIQRVVFREIVCQVAELKNLEPSDIYPGWDDLDF